MVAWRRRGGRGLFHDVYHERPDGAGYPRRLNGEKIPLWVADYGPQCRTPPGWPRWTFWQYTAGGRIDGANGIVDLNKFNGTPEEFAKFR